MALASLIISLATIPVTGAAVYWAWRARRLSHRLRPGPASTSSPFMVRYRHVTVDGRTFREFQDPVTHEWDPASRKPVDEIL